MWWVNDYSDRVLQSGVGSHLYRRAVRPDMSIDACDDIAWSEVVEGYRVQLEVYCRQG